MCRCTVEPVFTSFSDDCFTTPGLPSSFPSGCTYPPTVNDADVWSRSKEIAQSYLGKDKVPAAANPQPS